MRFCRPEWFNQRVSRSAGWLSKMLSKKYSRKHSSRECKRQAEKNLLPGDRTPGRFSFQMCEGTEMVEFGLQ